MAVKRSPALWIYRAAWEPAIVLIEILAGLEKISRRKLWPTRWRLNERLGWNWPASISQPVIWMHAASLGECKGLWALAQELENSSNSFVLTTNTITALEFLTKQINSDENPSRWHAVLAPLDHPGIVRRFIRHFEIRALVLYEVELWPHFILTARKLNKPVFWVSARMNASAQKRYGAFPGARRTVLQGLSWIQTQSEEEAKILNVWGCESVEVGADLKGLYYLSALNSGMAPDLPWSERSGVAFLSLHVDELPFVLPAIESWSHRVPLFIFPRKSEELPRFQKLLGPLGFKLHSQDPTAHLLLVDSFGRILEFLKRCHTAVIGGSFAPYGGHNLWEPLTANVRIVLGPYHSNQEYLVTKLGKTGLLRISESSLNKDLLFKYEADPGSVCREFVAHENRILLESTEQIEKRLTLWA